MALNSDRYFVIKGQQKLGPFRQDELLELWKTPALNGTTQLSQESDGKIITAGELFPVVDQVMAPAEQFSPKSVSDHLPPPNTNPPIDQTYQPDSAISRIYSLNMLSLEKISYAILVGVLIGSFHFMMIGSKIFCYLLIIASVLLLGSFYLYWRRARIIIDTPTSKTRAAVIGAAEFIGRAISLNNLYGPFSGKPCILCEYQKSRKNSSKSNEYLSQVRAAPFELEDDTGRILVDPHGAEINFLKNSWEWDFEIEVTGDTIGRERLIQSGEPVYVLGRVDRIVNREGKEHLLVHQDPKIGLLIFRGNESKVLKKLKQKSIATLCLGILVLIIAIILLDKGGIMDALI